MLLGNNRPIFSFLFLSLGLVSFREKEVIGLKLQIEYGYIDEEELGGFYYWFRGGEIFGICPGNFEGPFETLKKAEQKAQKVGEKEGLEVIFVED